VHAGLILRRVLACLVAHMIVACGQAAPPPPVPVGGRAELVIGNTLLVIGEDSVLVVDVGYFPIRALRRGLSALARHVDRVDRGSYSAADTPMLRVSDSSSVCSGSLRTESRGSGIRS
jgi:hypothetical protein